MITMPYKVPGESFSITRDDNGTSSYATDGRACLVVLRSFSFDSPNTFTARVYTNTQGQSSGDYWAPLLWKPSGTAYNQFGAIYLPSGGTIYLTHTGNNNNVILRGYIIYLAQTP